MVSLLLLLLLLSEKQVRDTFYCEGKESSTNISVNGKEGSGGDANQVSWKSLEGDGNGHNNLRREMKGR